MSRKLRHVLANFAGRIIELYGNREHFVVAGVITNNISGIENPRSMYEPTTEIHLAD